MRGPGVRPYAAPTSAQLTGRPSSAAGCRTRADILAFIIILWILMYLLDANRGNDFVQWVHD
ncbi:hypothetical protein ACWECC_37515, partial [Streptomyces microflavus]